MLSRMVSTGLEQATAVVEAARHNPQAAAVALGLGAAGAVALYAMTRKGEHLRPRRKAGQVHLVGSGVASLTAAVELVQHGIAEGRNIHIYEELKIEGGCLDGCGDAENGFVCRGGRMFDTECYLAVWDLIKRIPSAEREGKTVMQDYEDFNTTFKTNGKARLVRSGGINAMADGWKMGLSTRDKFEMVKMMACSEASLGRKGINEFFNPHFFKTPFWYMWSTTFAFQPWHSAVEFKRYMHKFQHEFPKMFDLGGVKRTKYNQYDSLALPLRKYLVAQGVQFHLSTCVVDAKFEKNATTGVYRCQRLAVLHPGKSVPEVINLAEADTAIFTVGSMTADATLGHTKVAPPPPNPDGCQSWSFKLWSKMALQLPREIVGNPANFLNRVPEAAWHSFTCTFKANTEFLDAMVKFTGNEPGTGALCTIIDSPWYMSTVIPKQPHFINQPEDCQVLWGYALNLDVPGKFVKKTIVECTGEEILIELMGHMNLWSKEQQERILKTTITIPCNMPYITSMFLTRDKTDRPPVVPEKADNFAFVGQYVEYPDDTVFTVDMSVRSAMMAVRGIFGVKELVVPKIVYINDPATLVRIVKASF